MLCSRKLYKGNSYEICLPITDSGVTVVRFYTRADIVVEKEPIITSGSMCFDLSVEDLDVLEDGVLRYEVVTESGSYDTNSPYVVKTPEDYDAKTLEEYLEESYESGYTDGQAGCSGDCSGVYESGYTDGYESGYTSGSTDGYQSGYTSGNTDGYSDGYSDGYADGQDDCSGETKNIDFSMRNITLYSGSSRVWVHIGTTGCTLSERMSILTTGGSFSVEPTFDQPGVVYYEVPENPTDQPRTAYILADFCDTEVKYYRGKFHIITQEAGSGKPACYESGYTDGYQSGYTNGQATCEDCDDAYQSGFTSGYTAGFNDGELDGYEEGYESGYASGSTDGYQSGYTDGVATCDDCSGAYNSGYTQGEADGYQTGYEDGSQSGYSSGYTDGAASVHLQSKNLGSYSANGTYNYAPDSGYSGISGGTVTVNIPPDIWTGTQVQYDALQTYDNNVLYIIIN